MNVQELYTSFKQAYPDSGDPRLFYAPGRVNLIGEHIDYNGGYVFPCALTLGTYAAICRREDNIMRLTSANIAPPITVTNANLSYDAAHGWANNPKAVTKLLIDMGHNIGGYDLYVWGNLPHNAGLSSSASINVLVALALCTVFCVDMSMVDIAILCQRAENEYLGVNCGIMDQFASAMGRKNHAILLKCDTLEHTYVPIDMGDYKLILANTNMPRALADSKYNERRGECEKALADIKAVSNKENLCAYEPDDFLGHARAVYGETVVNQGLRPITEAGLDPKMRGTTPETDNETVFKRAYHVVNENARVKYAVDVLNKGELQAFGEAMTASHMSLRDFYEVTGAGLDALVLAANELEGPSCCKGLVKTKVLGSRMTGAGFGGCTVSIVHKDSVDEFISSVGKRYTQLTGQIADFYVAETDDGAREVWL